MNIALMSVLTNASDSANIMVCVCVWRYSPKCIDSVYVVCLHIEASESISPVYPSQSEACVCV